MLIPLTYTQELRASYAELNGTRQDERCASTEGTDIVLAFGEFLVGMPTQRIMISHCRFHAK